MNFDDIQAAWNDENSGKELKIPQQLDKLKSVQMPVEKLRSKMKFEFYVQIAATVLIGFVPSFIKVAPNFIFSYYLAYTLLLMIMAYFFTKFVLFYRSLNNNVMNSKDNLYALYYDIRLNIELYKACTYSIIPVALIIACIIIFSRDSKAFERLMQVNGTLTMKQCLFFIVMTVGLIAPAILLTEYVVKHTYGKYMKEVKAILDEFSE